MGEHTGDPRIETVVRLLDAYSRADLPAMQQWMSYDVTVEAVGNNPLAGTYRGIGGVMAFIGKSMNTFVPDSVKVEQVGGRGDEIQVIVAGEIALIDGSTHPVRIRQRYWFADDGRVSAIRAEAADDQAEFDSLVERSRLT